jgi:hypothetical protein
MNGRNPVNTNHFILILMIHLSTPQRFFIHELLHELHELTRNSKKHFFYL